jgi:hypothetical protein
MSISTLFDARPEAQCVLHGKDANGECLEPVEDNCVLSPRLGHAFKDHRQNIRDDQQADRNVGHPLERRLFGTRVVTSDDLLIPWEERLAPQGRKPARN